MITPLCLKHSGFCVLKLVPKSNKRTEGEVMDAARRRSVLAATVSRHFKDAQRIIANTARGQFPNSD